MELWIGRISAEASASIPEEAPCFCTPWVVASGLARSRADGPPAPTRCVSNVGKLMDAIKLWVEHWKDDARPFLWHRTAAEIIRTFAAAGLPVKSGTHH